jgi:hypothetical protein
VIETIERAGEERKAAEDRAFANKLAKRSPPNQVERAEIERARKRTKARAPRVAGGPLGQRARPHPAVPQPPPLTAAQPKRGAIKPALRSTSFVLSLFNRSTADYIVEVHTALTLRKREDLQSQR